MTPAARLTAWLFLAAMLLAAAPRAWAHGAAVHEPEPQAAASGALAIRDGVAPACPGPGSPAHACGCGNLSLCEPSTKLPAVHAQAGRLVVIPGFRDVPRLREVHGVRVLPRSAHRPRAPPFLA